MRTKRPPLTPERIAVLTAKGHLDLANHHWFLDLPADEQTRVYTLRARAEHHKCRAEMRQMMKSRTR
jgi:hypothetical protein